MWGDAGGCGEGEKKGCGKGGGGGRFSRARLWRRAAPAQPQPQSDEKPRLGGMALLNGVLVHGPNSWAAAIRTRDGELKVAAEYKRRRAYKVESALLRGPARLAEVFAVLPRIPRALPEARLPFQRASVLVAMAASAVAVRVVKSSRSLTPVARELVSGVLSAAP